ncbi:hydroxypyruvate isomerase family protein [Pseudonocardia sp. HH130630-07]|uniref:hydroxypyruvate isomerase family protein n=1 Tax=Pseudonocardia sp. HH130630-07 TaxID=1690815 RepID=UPI000814E41D|nr:TIM barrel protein [Pseudonocardia sp. HH130630-07]ANY08933.1 hydroxypyruvate isomerase [Pseudonocardia sp. HH130630-07]
MRGTPVTGGLPLPVTVNCSIVLAGLPLLQRPAAAAAAGFDAVEFWWPFDRPVPSDREVDAFVTAVADAGVVLSGLNFDAGDMPAGERGIASDPRRAGAFADNVDVAVGIGERLGTTGFNALYGNRIDGVTAQEQDELAAANLALAGRAAARIGAVALLEPVSGIDTYPLRTAADVVAVLDRVGSDDVRLLLDVFHLSVNGDDPAAAIAAYGDRIGHVQIADAPGRGEPGSGDLPVVALLDQVAATGYRGRVGLEYRPTTEDPFAWLAGTTTTAGGTA